MGHETSSCRISSCKTSTSLVAPSPAVPPAIEICTITFPPPCHKGFGLVCRRFLLLASFWIWKPPFRSFSTVLATLWSQTFICHDIRNILMLELFMLHGILQRVGIEGVFRVCLVVSSRWGFCRGCLKSIWGWFKILFGVVFLIFRGCFRSV